MDLFISIILSLVTGVIASTLVVVYFEHKQKLRYNLSRSHLIYRVKHCMFETITIVRVALKLPPPSYRNENEIIKELEEIMGRYNPEVTLNALSKMTPEKHAELYQQLQLAKDKLESLMSDAVAHKTLEDKVVSAIAELQDWIQSVLVLYEIIPELAHQKVDAGLIMRWSCAVSNLIENSFAILRDIKTLKVVESDELRWGSRELK